MQELLPRARSFNILNDEIIFFVPFVFSVVNNFFNLI
jgi:hypothetical protein